MQQGKPGTPIVYFVFDLLEVEGEPQLELPLSERRAKLERLLDRRNQAVRLSEAFPDGEALLEAAKEQRLEGIVSKRASQPYVSGRAPHWLKTKCTLRQEFVIAGLVLSTTSRKAVGSLVLGANEAGRLIHVGRVGTGFTVALARSLWSDLQPLRRPASPFPDKLPPGAAAGPRDAAAWHPSPRRAWNGQERVRQGAGGGNRTADADPGRRRPDGKPGRPERRKRPAGLEDR